MEDKNKKIFTRILALTKEYRQLAAISFVSMLVTALTEIALPKALGELIDKGFGGHQQNQVIQHFPLWYVPAILIGIFLVRGVATFVTSYVMSKISVNVLSDLRNQLFHRILHVPVQFFHDDSSGRIINAIMFEPQQIVDMIKNSVTTLVRDTLTVVALMSFLIYSNWKLTLVTIIIIPGVSFLVRKLSRRLRVLNAQQLEVSGELTQVIEEGMRGHQIIRIFGGQKYEARRFHEKSDKLGRYAMKTTVSVSYTTPLTQILAAIAVSIVVIMALIQARQSATTVGDFTTFITALLMLLTPLKRLADLNGPIQRGVAACESVFAMIDKDIESQEGQVLSARARGELELRDLSFRYPNQENLTLNRVNLHIQAGETIAIVGASGGGKTSLVNLIPRFYAPESGQILLDGSDIHTLNLASLRNQIAMVGQNVILFDDTLAANIAYGDEHADEARIRAAALAANLSDLIAELPQGLQTQIGDNGMRLSGGQRQRVAIARALYKDAPILILDEATSALDTESERVVQSALERLMEGRTTLVIAHRLSTIENADRIVVLAEGRIVESGTHTSLLSSNGMYANLHRLQFAQ